MLTIMEKKWDPRKPTSFYNKQVYIHTYFSSLSVTNNCWKDTLSCIDIKEYIMLR